MNKVVLNARPTPEVEGDSYVLCHSFLRQNEIDLTKEKIHTALLVEHQNLVKKENSERLEVYVGKHLELRKEIHHEFVAYIWIMSAQADAESLDNLPSKWLYTFPGKVLARTFITFTSCTETFIPKGYLNEVFGSNQLIGNMVEQDSARIWTDFYAGAEREHLRVHIEDFSLGPRRRGRLSQNIIELENYRSLAEIAFPIAENIIFELEMKEIELAVIVKEITQVNDTHEQKKLLYQLFDLSVISENWRSSTGHRFSATSAYQKIIEDRLMQLDESKVLGYQSFSKFLNRNTMPTFRTCDAANHRLNVFIMRIDRATSLLSTHISSTIEQQNNNLLCSVDKQNKQQIILQETVEAFAVVAISYNGCALLTLFIESLKAQGFNINISLIMSFMIPGSLVTSVVLMRFLRKRKLIKS